MSLLELMDPGPKKKKKNYIGEDIKSLYKKSMSYDNKPAYMIVKDAAVRSGVNPAFLMSSAFQEGMNKAIASPDEISEAWSANVSDDNKDKYPVDGFYSYGLDRFGDRYKELQKYLPKDFDYLPFDGVNEKNEKIKTGAFKNNTDALIAKGAMLRLEMDTVKKYATKKGLDLDQNALEYFTMASYNGGFGNARIMLDEYTTAKDKKSFIEKGETSRKGVHKNIEPRMENIGIAKSILDSEVDIQSGPFTQKAGLAQAVKK